MKWYNFEIALINYFFFIYSSLKNITVTTAMLDIRSRLAQAFCLEYLKNKFNFYTHDFKVKMVLMPYNTQPTG